MVVVILWTYHPDIVLLRLGLQGLRLRRPSQSLTDLRGIAEGDREEQGGDGERQDEDVSEAFHGRTSWRSAEGSTGGRHVALRQTAGGTVAQFLEQTKLHLFTEIRIDTGEHIAVEGASTVPDVTEEEEQREAGVAEGEPAAG